MYLKEEVLDKVFNEEDENLRGKFILSKKDLGFINLPTGKVVGNDPFILYEYEGFTKSFTPGKYPISIFVLKILSNEDERVALASIYFSDKKAVSWEMAVKPKQDLALLSKNSYYGYAVESGAGGFMDEKTIEYIYKLRESSEVEFENMIYKDMNQSFHDLHVNNYSGLNYVVDEKNDLNIVLFSSGLGDGAYPSYYGYDENKEICCLVTDFCILDDLDMITRQFEMWG